MSEKDLSIYEPFYSSFRDEIVELLSQLRTQHKGTVDVYMVTSRIKSFDSIKEKIRGSKGKYTKLSDLQDVAGARVICHCLDDLERFDIILADELKKRFIDVDRSPRSGKDGYRGIHYVIKKVFDIEDKKEKLSCEIQLRTVLQDAWAIQSHQYGYKKKTEGDADVLKQVVSGILDNCENLWELVKKGTKSDEDIGSGEINLIYQDTSEKIERAGQFTSADSIEQLIAAGKTNEIEDILNAEFLSVKKVWEEEYAKATSPDQALGILEKMEMALNHINAIGFFAIKHDSLPILRKVLDTFGPIVSLAERQAGYTNILSIPSASIHNSFYYFGIYALWKLKGKAMHLLLNYKVERDYNGQLYYFRIWESASVLAPEVVHGAEKTFNRLKEDFKVNNFIKTFITVDPEEFLNLACQFNMLFCLLAVAEEESEKGKPWAFPNFGRFYGERVYKLIERIKNREEYQIFITNVMHEDVKIFADKFNGRIQILSKRLGSGFWWDSIGSWDGGRG